MEIKTKQELLEYIASLEERSNALEERLSALENPKDGDGDGKVNEDEPKDKSKEDEVDEIEKLLED